MDWLTQAITQRLNRLKEDIRAAMETKSINASHRTEKALSVVRYDGGVKLVLGAGNVAPLETLETGYAAGVQKDSPTFRAVLVQWSRDKGILFANEKERTRFAYFLSKRIAREGTLRSQSPEDVYSTLTRIAVRDLRVIVSQNIKEIIHASINKF